MKRQKKIPGDDDSEECQNENQCDEFDDFIQTKNKNWDDETNRQYDDKKNTTIDDTEILLSTGNTVKEMI